MQPTEKDAKDVFNQTVNENEKEADAADVKLDVAAQALIGHHLRALYGEIVKEPVPDRFLKLLQDLESKEQK